MTPQWTPAQKVAVLMRLPWTVRVETDAVDNSFVARVAEVPDAIATGSTESALSLDLWHSLKASLECRLEFGDELPVPQGTVLPWEAGKAPAAAPGVQKIRINKELFAISTGSLAAV